MTLISSWRPREWHSHSRSFACCVFFLLHTPWQGSTPLLIWDFTYSPQKDTNSALQVYTYTHTHTTHSYMTCAFVFTHTVQYSRHVMNPHAHIHIYLLSPPSGVKRQHWAASELLQPRATWRAFAAAPLHRASHQLGRRKQTLQMLARPVTTVDILTILSSTKKPSLVENLRFRSSVKSQKNRNDRFSFICAFHKRRRRKERFKNVLVWQNAGSVL